eukprot:m.57955 g.57955  ORF g.57955 m.57955 type:complete len:65 (-) comp15630_c0_seq1:1110-1304(-)
MLTTKNYSHTIALRESFQNISELQTLTDQKPGTSRDYRNDIPETSMRFVTRYNAIRWKTLHGYA